MGTTIRNPWKRAWHPTTEERDWNDTPSDGDTVTFDSTLDLAPTEFQQQIDEVVMQHLHPMFWYVDPVEGLIEYSNA